MEVRAALDRLELLVVQDPFLTETAQMAHAVLPAMTSAEKDGTFTNLEGRVLRVRRGHGSHRGKFARLADHDGTGQRLGCQWEYESSNDIQSEIMKLLPATTISGSRDKVVPSVDRYLSNGYRLRVAARYRDCAPRLQERQALCAADGTGPVSFR